MRGAWKEAVADGAQAADAYRQIIYNEHTVNFQPHNQPFNYFLNYAPGTATRAEHLKDGAEFYAAIDAGTLPQVAFYAPEGIHDQHPWLLPRDGQESPHCLAY